MRSPHIIWAGLKSNDKGPCKLRQKRLKKKKRGQTHREGLWRQRQRLERGGHKSTVAMRSWDRPGRIFPRASGSRAHLLVPRLLASRIVSEFIAVVLSHEVCGNSLLQPQDTNILLESSINSLNDCDGGGWGRNEVPELSHAPFIRTHYYPQYPQYCVCEYSHFLLINTPLG